MTRKRFIKLLMSRRYDRNHANEIANLTCNFSVAYEQIRRWNEEEYWN